MDWLQGAGRGDDTGLGVGSGMALGDCGQVKQPTGFTTGRILPSKCGWAIRSGFLPHRMSNPQAER